MKAALFKEVGQPLEITEVECPQPKSHELLLKVLACGVCRTDLHILDGELTPSTTPLIMGHQIVGEIIKIGDSVSNFLMHQQVGVPWLGKTCETCFYCKNKQENLCDLAEFTGFTRPGGFAEYVAVDSRYVYSLPKGSSPEVLAPLLCPGFIGHRALSFVEEAKSIGFFGFGSSARLLLPIANHQKKEVFVFTKPGDLEGQKQALENGASWAGSSLELPPKHLDAVLIFAPVGDLVVQALKCVRKGGKVVCAGIHMSPIPSFPYALLWEERNIQSVANLTRQDGQALLSIAQKIKLEADVQCFELSKINQAFEQMRLGTLKKSAVVRMA